MLEGMRNETPADSLLAKIRMNDDVHEVGETDTVRYDAQVTSSTNWRSMGNPFLAGMESFTYFIPLSPRFKIENTPPQTHSLKKSAPGENTGSAFFQQHD
jgi:hypothetical protein